LIFYNDLAYAETSICALSQYYAMMLEYILLPAISCSNMTFRNVETDGFGDAEE